MRLSNTLMINEALLPSKKKAFTLAEVLITLSILGVVAALTIPALVNRNSDIAAQTKLKKAIAAYETAVNLYMAENAVSNAKMMFGTVEENGTESTDCSNAGRYFKIVKQSSGEGDNGCKFTTADGAYYVVTPATGNAVVFDSETSPRYGVVMWNKNGQVNGLGTTNGTNNVIATEVAAAITNAASPTLNPNTRKITSAPDFLKAKNPKYFCLTSNVSFTNGATAPTCATGN